MADHWTLSRKIVVFASEPLPFRVFDHYLDQKVEASDFQILV